MAAIDWQMVGLVYLCGIPAWCFVMSLLGEPADRNFLMTAFIWPLMAGSLLGQILRRLLP